MILLSSVKTLTNSEDFSECRIKGSVLASFPAIGRFSPVFTPYWMLEKSAKMYISPAAFEIIFWITGSFKNSC
jgi:hypothetical protein